MENFSITFKTFDSKGMQSLYWFTFTASLTLLVLGILSNLGHSFVTHNYEEQDLNRLLFSEISTLLGAIGTAFIIGNEICDGWIYTKVEQEIKSLGENELKKLHNLQCIDKISGLNKRLFRHNSMVVFFSPTGHSYYIYKLSEGHFIAESTQDHYDFVVKSSGLIPMVFFHPQPIKLHEATDEIRNYPIDTRVVIPSSPAAPNDQTPPQ